MRFETKVQKLEYIQTRQNIITWKKPMNGHRQMVILSWGRDEESRPVLMGAFNQVATFTDFNHMLESIDWEWMENSQIALNEKIRNELHQG